MINFNEYNTLVCENLLENRPYEDFKGMIDILYHDGYTVNAAKKFIRCTEEYDPDLDEATALKKMDYIYKNRHRDVL